MITITFLDEEPADEEPAYEEAPVEILLQHFNEDGSVDELELEGDLSDARSLVLTLHSEGSCVEVVIAQPEEGEAEEVPEAGEEVTEPVESLEPVSP